MRIRIFATIIVASFAASAFAKPSFNNAAGCLGCHSAVTGKMSITAPGGLTTNLGTQLDGSSRGALDTFNVVAGQSFTIPIVVSAGSGNFGLGVYEVADGGVKTSQSNHLSLGTTPSGWTLRTSPSRYTYGAAALSGSPQTINFTMLVNGSTPSDYYDLQIQWGHANETAQAERVYVHVLPAPEPGTLGAIALAGLIFSTRRGQRSRMRDETSAE